MESEKLLLLQRQKKTKGKKSVGTNKKIEKQ